MSLFYWRGFARAQATQINLCFGVVSVYRVIFERGAKVVLEKCSHLRVATTGLVTMHQRKINDNQFISQPRKVKIGNGLLVPFPVILLGMHRDVHGVKTAVTRHLHHPIHGNLQVEILFSQVETRLHIHLPA